MSKEEKESRAKDIRLKKKLLTDFGFRITKEIEDNLEQAGSDIERENYVLGLIHGFLTAGRKQADIRKEGPAWRNSDTRFSVPLCTITGTA